MTVYRTSFFRLKGIRTVLKQFDDKALTLYQRDLLKRRLEIVSWHQRRQATISETARRFETSRQHIRSLLQLNAAGGLDLLTPRRSGPRQKRGTRLTSEAQLQIERLALEFPDWGAKKLASYLPYCPTATYRHLKRKQLLVRDRCPGYHKKPSYRSPWKVKRERLPDDYDYASPGALVALDSIVEYVGPNRRKLFFICALDLATRIGIAVAVSHHSSAAARRVLRLMRSVLQTDIDAVLTDNGYEFLGDFQMACEQENIKHFFTRPRTPKDNAVAERFNQTLQRGFYWRCDLAKPLPEVNADLADWLIEYNCLRPHESLDQRPPVVTYFKMFYQYRIHTSRVDLRLWNRTLD